MTSYIAIKDGSGIHLSKSEQMDRMLSNGFSIYKIDDGVKTLIATPEKGFLAERPIIGQSATPLH